MRVLHVVPTYLPATRYGGPIYSVHGLCRALASQGHEVTVFTTSVDGPYDSDVPHDEPVSMDGVSVRYFRSRRLRRLYYAPQMTTALRTLLPQVDIVHLHSVFLWPTNMAARRCVKAGKPYVLAPRGMLVPELIRRKNALLKTAWLRFIEAWTVRHASAIHCTSTRELHAAREVYPRLPGAPCVVPNGVDAPQAGQAGPGSQAIRDVAAGGPYCLFLGRLHWVKGLDRLLRSIAGTNVRVVLCGNDEEGYARVIDDLVRSLGLQANVVRLAPVHGDDKWALIAGARMLVLPSISENFGNVVPEAMAMGCPVVTMREVGAAEVVEDAGAGLVCEQTDDALRHALLRLWSDDGLRAEFSQRARAYVDEHLRWDRVAAHMAEHYEAVLRS